jgi:hypothetical protein
MDQKRKKKVTEEYAISVLFYGVIAGENGIYADVAV